MEKKVERLDEKVVKANKMAADDWRRNTLEDENFRQERVRDCSILP